MNLLQDAKCCLLATVLLGGCVSAQKIQSQPVIDSAAQAGPLSPALSTPATDTSEQASPIGGAHRPSHGVPARTAVHIVLNQDVDSGTLKNGQIVHGRVSTANAAPTGDRKRTGVAVLKPGTPVSLSVIATVPAGKLNAVGEMSLQLVQVGGQTVYTDVQTFRGKPGKRDLPDSAPAVGTNAGLPAGTELTFTIQPQPGFSEPTPQARKNTPGSVTGLASGSKPANFGKPLSAAPSTNTGTSPANGASNSTTDADKPQPAQHNGQVGSTPNQPASPTTTSPTSATQPH